MRGGFITVGSYRARDAACSDCGRTFLKTADAMHRCGSCQQVANAESKRRATAKGNAKTKAARLAAWKCQS
jgi:hypothetical protein